MTGRLSGQRPRGRLTPRFTTRELSPRTFSDFARLFSQGGGWDHCGCLAFQGIFAPRDVRKWADKRDYCLAIKRDLVGRGMAHGILVYASAEPVGWCQFGPVGELPIPESERSLARPRRKTEVFPDGADRVWRITCFVTQYQYRRQGVASLALRAALRAIRTKGGGLVEAYPVAYVRSEEGDEGAEGLARQKAWERERSRLIRAHGGRSAQVRHHLHTREPVTAVVDGVGPVNATYWGLWYTGTVPMFEREGFRAVSVRPPARQAAPGPTGRPARIVMHKLVLQPPDPRAQRVSSWRSAPPEAAGGTGD